MLPASLARCKLTQSWCAVHQSWLLRRPGDSQRKSGRLAQIDSQKTPIFIAFERFATIASNPRFPILVPRDGIPKKKGFGSPEIRKSVVSTKFLPVILGPEMAAPILWAPGIFWFFLLENPHAHKIPPFGGGGGGSGFFQRGGWKCQFYFYGRGDFSDETIRKNQAIRANLQKNSHESGHLWDVLNGVGVDGVGVIFPFFYAFFPFFYAHFSPFFTHFSHFSPKGQGQTTAIYCKNGEFHSDPVCTDPVQNFLGHLSMD